LEFFKKRKKNELNFYIKKKVKFCPENSLEQQNSRKQNFVLIFLNGILTKLKN